MGSASRSVHRSSKEDKASSPAQRAFVGLQRPLRAVAGCIAAWPEVAKALRVC